MSSGQKQSAFSNCKDVDCLPDAIGNEEREAQLMERQRRDDGRNCCLRLISRDRNLIAACFVLVIVMNLKQGRYVLYPFKIFSTWVHEICHGIAALFMRGSIKVLKIKSDGGGYAVTAVPGAAWRRGFVASGGYPGTAVTGGLMLLFRRTTLGPTIGTIGIATCLLVSVALYVRDTFGLLMLSGEGIFLLLAAWLLPAVWLDNLYNFLSVTISLNAVSTVKDLFAIGKAAEEGEEDVNTDAHSVAGYWGGDYRFWAIAWMVTSITATFLGIVCARDARELQRTGTTHSTTAATTDVIAVNYSTAAPIEASVAPAKTPPFLAHTV